jgi:hypothetical protein
MKIDDCAGCKHAKPHDEDCNGICQMDASCDEGLQEKSICRPVQDGEKTADQLYNEYEKSEYIDRCAIAAMAALNSNPSYDKYEIPGMATLAYEIAAAMWEEKQRREGK